MITAIVIEDSVSEVGKRLTTVELSYPRFIHSELMTHRAFSRNAMSSRAVPVAKMIQQVLERPVVPFEWGLNEPGMQSTKLADAAKAKLANEIWLEASRNAAGFADALYILGIHKQLVNRLLEPFQWMRTIVTATEWANFFELRDHKDAEPHFQFLAKAIKLAINESVPVERGTDPFATTSWHLPYVSAQERASELFLQLAKVSGARCARVSYLTHDGKDPSLLKDIALYENLVGSKPMHASPIEHQGFPCDGSRRNQKMAGNFVGWVQYRKLVEGINV